MDVLYLDFKDIERECKLDRFQPPRVPIGNKGQYAELYLPRTALMSVNIKTLTKVNESGRDYLKYYAGKEFDEVEFNRFDQTVSNRVVFWKVWNDTMDQEILEWENFLKEVVGFELTGFFPICWNVLWLDLSARSNGKNVFIHADRLREWTSNTLPFHFTLVYSNDEAMHDNFVEHIREDLLKVMLENKHEWESALT